VKLTLAAIGLHARSAGPSRASAFEELVEAYLARTAAYAQVETAVFRSAKAFFEARERQSSRMGSVLVLLDGRGQQFSSEELAWWLRRMRDEGQQRIVFAVGPPDGWSASERERATLLLSMGPMTLPHELARVVLSEQLYRAFTILAGHPYHLGH
jgi:23S rRNA (pseudouridine1915-N3)-methyltransferase